jgi:hypothetical protein
MLTFENKLADMIEGIKKELKECQSYNNESKLSKLFRLTERINTMKSMLLPFVTGSNRQFLAQYEELTELWYDINGQTNLLLP